MRVAIVGKGRAGKDEAAKWLDRNTTLKYSFGTSYVICEHIAITEHRDLSEVIANRHVDRDAMRQVGNALKATYGDPAYLARQCLKVGDIANGIRERDEIEAVQREGLVTLTLWIERDVPDDPSLKFGREVADAVVENNGTLADLHAKLRRLAASWGVLKH